MGTASEDLNRLERGYRYVPERGIQGQMSDIRPAPATMSLSQRVRSHGCCVLGWGHGYRETTIMHRVRFHLPGSVMGVPFPVGIGNCMAMRGRPIPVGNETAGRALTSNAMEPSDAIRAYDARYGRRNRRRSFTMHPYGMRDMCHPPPCGCIVPGIVADANGTRGGDGYRHAGTEGYRRAHASAAIDTLRRVVGRSRQG